MRLNKHLGSLHVTVPCPFMQDTALVTFLLCKATSHRWNSYGSNGLAPTVEPMQGLSGCAGPSHAPAGCSQPMSELSRALGVCSESHHLVWLLDLHLSVWGAKSSLILQHSAQGPALSMGGVTAGNDYSEHAYHCLGQSKPSVSDPDH